MGRFNCFPAFSRYFLFRGSFSRARGGLYPLHHFRVSSTLLIGREPGLSRLCLWNRTVDPRPRTAQAVKAARRKWLHVITAEHTCQHIAVTTAMHLEKRRALSLRRPRKDVTASSQFAVTNDSLPTVYQKPTNVTQCALALRFANLHSAPNDAMMRLVEPHQLFVEVEPRLDCHQVHDAILACHAAAHRQGRDAHQATKRTRNSRSRP